MAFLTPLKSENPLPLFFTIAFLADPTLLLAPRGSPVEYFSSSSSPSPFARIVMCFFMSA